MIEKIELANIVRSDDFLREINRAATISYENNKEAGFNIYTDEHLSQSYVNRAVLGKDHSIETDMTVGPKKHEPKNGFHIPMFNYRLVHVHFHPPKSDLHPSRSDIWECLAASRANVNLRDSSSEFEREVYDDKKETKLIGYERDYPNSVSIIGLVKDDLTNIELLVYQGIIFEQNLFEKFCEFVADYCENLYGIEYDSFVIELSGFPTRFRSTKRVLEFLNASKCFQAVDVKIKNGQLSDKDWKKLNKFQLIHTRFFSEEFDFSDDLDEF